MTYELPSLLYSYNALEPFIDTQTMELHHKNHHATYVSKLNEALEKFPSIADKPLEELLQNLEVVPEAIRTAVQNHGGGHYNHSLFWQCMTPPAQGGGEAPRGELAEKINRAFGSYEQFKEQFTAAALGVFGSGWAWLMKDEADNLKIITTRNQDTPCALTPKSSTVNPIICCDVWEHAYYLKHQNRRADYITAWWNVVSWKKE